MFALTKEFPTEQTAVLHIAKSCHGGLRFHDLMHSYATWLNEQSCIRRIIRQDP